MGRLRLLLLLGAAALGAAVLAAAGKCRAPPALHSRPFCSLSPGPAGLRPRPRACRRGTCCGGGCGLPRGPALPAAAAGSRNPPPPAWFLPPPRGALRGPAAGSAGAGGARPAGQCWARTALLGPALYPCPAPLLLPGAPGVLSPAPARVSLLYRGSRGEEHTGHFSA